MSESPKERNQWAEALKRLRKLHKERVKEAAAGVKQHNTSIRAIREALGDESLTVPEIAERTGLNPPDVLWYVASLKKYGRIAEGDKDGAYFRYHLTGGSAAGDSGAETGAGAATVH